MFSHVLLVILDWLSVKVQVIYWKCFDETTYDMLFGTLKYPTYCGKAFCKCSAISCYFSLHCIMFQSDGKSRTADCQPQPLSQYGFISLLVEPITCSFLPSVRASVLFFQCFDTRWRFGVAVMHWS